MPIANDHHGSEMGNPDSQCTTSPMLLPKDAEHVRSVTEIVMISARDCGADDPAERVTC